MKINCLIVDDEPMARGVIRNHLQRLEAFVVLGECPNAYQAINVLQTQPVQVLFLDIQMPELSGLDLLRTLAPGLRSLGLRPVIRGRGWPPVDGWDVRAGFLSEDAFDEAIGQAACVLLPYRLLFQSDVATRAAELGVPVVGPASSNVSDLFGATWPGAVPEGAPPTDWLSRTAAVAAWQPEDVLLRASRQFVLGEAAWRSWLDA